MSSNSLLKSLNVWKRGADSSPYKYLLLLSIVALFKSNKDHPNRFTFNELEPIFLSYINNLFPKMPEYRKALEYPFYHLQNDGFWHLQVREGKETLYQIYKSQRLTKKRLLETVDYAYLDTEVYQLMRDQDQRNRFEGDILSLLGSPDPSIQYPLASQTPAQSMKVAEPSSLFSHEQTAIGIIKQEIEKHHLGRLISNIWVYDAQSQNYYEYDVILIAHAGIYVVELKHWSGHTRIAPYNWELNGVHYRPDPHRANSLKCRILKGIYQHRFPTYPNVWIESVVVFTNPDSTLDGAAAPKTAAEQAIHNPTFASISDFIAYLKKREAMPGGHLLDNQQIEVMESFLKSLSVPKQNIKYAVPGYETIEYISQKPECIELIARPTSGYAKGLNRFRVFRPPHQLDTEEKKVFLKKAYNTLNAVQQIGDNPYIQKVWAFENEDGDIIEGSDWSETGTLRDLVQQQGALPVAKALSITCQIATALDRAHQANIIHRAVKPENILMVNEIPKLTNFDLSYQIEDYHITVLPDPAHIKDDGYAAPELLTGEDIDEGTDFFSLGVIAYEMVTGKKPFSTVKAFMAHGGILDEETLQELAEKGVPDSAVDAIKAMITTQRLDRLKDPAQVIAAFRQDGNEGPVTAINRVLQPGESYDDVYEIIELIAIGAEAQIYKAKGLRGQPVAIKLFNREVPLERIQNEINLTNAVQSTYVVRCLGIARWKGDRFFIVLDYIDGESMRKWIERQKRPDIETFRTVARHLIEAVRAFHQHRDADDNPQPLVHSDIKPDNVLISSNCKATLIDCGSAGVPRIDIFQGTIGYVPPDSIRGTDMEFSESADLFALGVTLWEWLLGTKPYEHPAIGDSPLVPEYIEDEIRVYLPWLKKAVATEASQRFNSIEEMRQAFQNPQQLDGQTASPPEEATAQEVEEVTAMVAAPEPPAMPQGNLFVTYLNSLSNASAYNENALAESQLSNPFFEKIFVRNPVAEFIYRKLMEERQNVILTGNAGDGKTTVAAEVFYRAQGQWKVLDPSEEIRASNIVIIKDMSELNKDSRAQILAEAAQASQKKYLIVSNTGTLLESWQGLKIDGEPADENELLAAMEANAPETILGGRFLLINLGRIDSIDIARDVFQRMLDPSNWQAYISCPQSSHCPIFKNVQLLRQHLDTVCQRVTLLYQRLYEYGARLTIRQITGHLAYAITAGLNCPDIQTMSITRLQQSICTSFFFNRFFGDDGHKLIPEAMQLLPVQRIREAELGLALDPQLEKRIWVNGDGPLMLAGLSLEAYQLLMEAGRMTPAIRQQVRRLVYFFSQDQEVVNHYVSVFLQSPMLIKFIKLCRGTEKKVPPGLENIYKHRILQVLQEYFTGIRLPEVDGQENDLYITLNYGNGSAKTQLVLADLRPKDFYLIIKPRYQLKDHQNGMLCLHFELGQAEATMELDLPFLDYVARRYEGEIAEELSAHYVDRLERFKVSLLDLSNRYSHGRVPYLQLLRKGPDRKFHLKRILVANNSLEVVS